jgi:putative protease
MSRPDHPPEIMSPAGHWPELRAAIEAGADAVYFGLTHFTARAKVGFALHELPDVMAQLHERGVRGYVTFNTLVFDHELDEAGRSLAAIAEAGADAIIVQDPAVGRLAQRIAPHLELHGSTQMSITSAEGCAVAASFGMQRVVLARELSLEQVRAVRAGTDLDLEMFVHGALCVSYSGQCFSSEAWGGRSANRGQCAQACRLPYEMLVDGQARPLDDARYLLSPGDLYALEQIPEILDIGIASLKIEGRYKGPEYVALTTRAYREAVDAAWAGRSQSVGEDTRRQLEQVYSRGLGAHFVAGTNHQTVVDGRAPRHRGLRLGTVSRVDGGDIVVRLTGDGKASPPKAGDGVVFDGGARGTADADEEGGRLFAVRSEHDGSLRLAFGHDSVDASRVQPGDWVWRTHDPDIDRAARSFTQAETPLRRQALTAHVTARVGHPVQIEWRLRRRPDVTVTTVGDAPLQAARQHAPTVSFLREQLGRLGGTPFELQYAELMMEGAAFLPASMLAPLRRRAVDELTARLRSVAPRDGAAAEGVVRELRRRQPAGASDSATSSPVLHLLVRSDEQLDAAIELRPASITLDYLDLYGLKPAVDRVRSAGLALRVASPRVLKPGEEGIGRFLRRLDCHLLVRPAGLLHQLADDPPPMTGDFSLNAANTVTAVELLDRGLQRITPGHDLNGDQIAHLARTVGGEQIEVVAWHHLPVFHTEHCVFCRFLSEGTSYRDCGRPCESHRVSLKDPRGRAHPVLADVGCRNTVFGAEAQEASRHLAAWLDAGIRHVRLEFAHEAAEQVRHVTAAFGAALRGDLDAAGLRRRLREVSESGTTEGSLFVPADYLELPVLQ